METPSLSGGWLDRIQADWVDSEEGDPLGALIRLRRVLDADLCPIFGDDLRVGVSVGVDGRPSGLVLFGGLTARAALRLLALLVAGRMSERAGFAALDAPPRVLAALTSALDEACARLTTIPEDSLVLPTATT